MDFSLSIGFNGNIDDFHKIMDTGAEIESVYSGGVVHMITGGRSQYAQNIDELKKVIFVVKKRGVKYEIALNTSCGLHPKSDHDWWRKIADYIKELEYCGADRIIASHPFIISLVKTKTNMEIVASTICEISEPRMAAYYEELGANIIIPSMNINFNMEKLKKIKNRLKHAKIRIMVNEHCLGDCPWRRFHHNSYSHDNIEFDYHINCKKQYLEKPYLFLTNNCIRPEDIHHYFDITKNFKIVGRLVNIDVLAERIVAYKDQRYEKNYINISDEKLSNAIYIPNTALSNLFRMKTTCDFDCNNCNYCIDLYNKVGKVNGSSYIS